jgi:adenylosuccinate synthase
VTELDALPERAASYVDFVERELEVPVSLIGTGAERERVLAPGPVEALARP